MEVTRIYCNTEDPEEVLYSVLMNEDEMDFYQREFGNKANKAATRRWKIQQAIDNGVISEKTANKYGGAEGIASAAERGSRHTRVVDGERVVSGRGVTGKVAGRQAAAQDYLEMARNNSPEGAFVKGSNGVGVYDAVGNVRSSNVNDRINYRAQNQTGISKDQFTGRDITTAREKVLAREAKVVPPVTPKTQPVITTPKPNPVAKESAAKTLGQKAKAAGGWIAKNPRKTAGIAAGTMAVGAGTAYLLGRKKNKQ